MGTLLATINRVLKCVVIDLREHCKCYPGNLCVEYINKIMHSLDTCMSTLSYQFNDDKY
jgi:hypothetical protein